MKKLDEILKLEKIATELTNIEPIKDKEYQILTYESVTTNKTIHRHVQIRGNYFKSSRKKL